jgi:Amt family ammonium transporter
VAGLVAITPAAASVDTWGALSIGFAAGVLCALAIGLKYRLGYDDSLDVIGVHFVGGWVGTLFIGLFANLDEGTTWAGAGDTLAPKDGLFYGGGLTQLGTQGTVALGATLVSFIVTLSIALVIKHTIRFRVTEEVEVVGIDLAEHGETAYEEAK